MWEQTNQYCQSTHQLVILTVDPAESSSRQVQQFRKGRPAQQQANVTDNLSDVEQLSQDIFCSRARLATQKDSGRCPAWKHRHVLKKNMCWCEHLLLHECLWRRTNEKHSTQQVQAISLNSQNYLISENDCCYESQSILHCIGTRLIATEINSCQPWQLTLNCYYFKCPSFSLFGFQLLFHLTPLWQQNTHESEQQSCYSNYWTTFVTLFSQVSRKSGKAFIFLKDNKTESENWIWTPDSHHDVWNNFLAKLCQSLDVPTLSLQLTAHNDETVFQILQVYHRRGRQNIG